MADMVMGAMPSIIPKLGELLKEEYKLQTGMKQRISSLTQELEHAQAALCKVAEVPWDQLDMNVQIWVRHLREASYDMEDILDTFLVRVQGPESAEEKQSFWKLLKKMAKSLKKGKIRRKISGDVTDIITQVQNMTEQCRRYKVRDIAVAMPDTASAVDPRLHVMYNKVEDLVGIDKSSGELISMLQSPQGAGTSNLKMKIVVVVGVGGLGKTTLAKAVYDKLKGDFDCTAFLPVGRNPNLHQVIQGILIELDRKYMDFNFAAWQHISQFVDELQKFLHEKRYFIVIDDLWRTSSWEVIADAFVKNNNGSRIIVTTRISQVATVVGEVYRMKPLSYINSKKLFCTRIFGGEDDCPDEQGLAEASDEILKKCGGVPLAIITMASLLATKHIKDWLNLDDFVLGESREIYNMMRILSLSYYDLPSHLQPCLLHLSMYPGDHVIKKNMLIWRWIAEGFVYSEATVGLFELGESYFNELINRSLIQLVEIKGTGLVYGCQVQDFVLQLIRSLCHDENFVSVFNKGGEIFTSSNFRRLAIHNRKEEHNLGNNMNQLRSLTAFDCGTYMIPPVSSFKYIRVLDLESCASMEGYDLKHLGELLLLRFISLRNTFVRTLPGELGSVKMLQTLELEGSGVEELPASIGELAGLMCLNTDWTTRVPDWIGMLTSLEQLVMYPGGGNDEHSVTWFVNGLGNLMELRELRFLIKADDEKQLRDLLQSLSNLSKIEVIHFDFYGVQWERGVQFEPTGFALSKSLRFLELPRFGFPRLPSWINAQDLPQLRHLSLMLLDVDEQDLEKLGRFTKLSHLHLLIVNTECSEAITCGSGAFQNLKFCSITKPFRFLQGVMPSLEVLDFHFNVQLLSGANNNLDFDFGLGNLPSLQQVTVQVNCLYSFPKEVDQAEAALRNAINMHPNSPILDIKLYGQRMKKTLVGDPKLLNPRKLEKTDNYRANKTSNSDEGKGVVVAQGSSKSAYYSKSLSLALDGINEPMDELIKRLSVVDHNAANNKKLKILSIVRSEGLGKITLAQKVFDKLSPQFDRAAFVLVGQNPDMRKVFTDILISLEKENYEDYHVAILDIMDLIGLVRKSLINNR